MARPGKTRPIPTEFPIESAGEVRVIGQPLNSILWQGKQWAVTEYGIEKLNGRYAIESAAFFTTHSAWAKSMGCDVATCWIRHMAEKGWVDMEDFQDAVDAFLMLFNPDGTRTPVQPPRFRDPAEVEYYAGECAERAYQLAKARASRGMV